MSRKCLIFALVFGVALLAPSTFCQFWYGGSHDLTNLSVQYWK